MKIPTEDFTDVTLAIDDTHGDDVRGGDWGAGRVGKCQIFYTDQYQQTRFYPEKSA